MEKFENYEDLELNSLIWIQSLPEQDQGYSNRILDDLAPFMGVNKFLFREYKIISKDEFISIVNHIRTLINKCNLKPIIHLDFHGDKYKGLQLISGENITWNELFEEFSLLNKDTNNNLVLFSSVCYGLDMYKELEPSKPCPAYLFISSHDKILFEDTENNTFPFYRDVLKNASFKEAFDEHLKGTLDIINCQELFYYCIKKYLDDNNDLDKYKNRLNYLTEETRSKLGIPSYDFNTINQIRIHVAKMLIPSQELIDKYTNSFLCGKKPLFDFNTFSK